MSAIEVKVPFLGDFADVPIIEVHVKPATTSSVMIRSSRWKATRRRSRFQHRPMGTWSTFS